MTVFKYNGRAKDGSQKKGIIDAPNESKAIEVLRAKGINPREIQPSKSILHKDIGMGATVKNQEFVIYCRQFATLIRAGISIVEATGILGDQTSSKPLKHALHEVEVDIRSGIPFSDATRKHSKIFPPLFINMISAGEATGSLEDTLDRLAVYYEKQYTLKKKIQSTLMYPVALLFMTVVVVIFMMIFIVPRFTSMFADFGAELPLITLLVLGMSELIQNYWWGGLLLVVVVAIVLIYLRKNSEAFRYNVSLLALKMPVFGKMLQKAAIARMTRTLSSLFSSSVPILNALTIVEKVVGNPVVGKVVLEARASLEQGGTLTAPLKKSWIFPPLVTQMTAIGEQTGSLDYMLEKIADFYEDDVDRTVDTLKALIEPLMIVVLAVVIGTIVLAIMVPMFSLFEQI